MATKQKPLSPKAQEVLEALQNAEGPMTLADLKEKVEGVNSAHLTALRNRDLVAGNEVEKEVVTVAKRKILEYSVAPEVETDTE